MKREGRVYREGGGGCAEACCFSAGFVRSASNVVWNLLDGDPHRRCVPICTLLHAPAKRSADVSDVGRGRRCYGRRRGRGVDDSEPGGDICVIARARERQLLHNLRLFTVMTRYRVIHLQRVISALADVVVSPDSSASPTAIH